LSAHKPARGTRGRSIARKLAMQALYQWQLNHGPPADLLQQYLESDAAAGVDGDYFSELVRGCTASEAVFREVIVAFIDRPLERLDPIETAILMIGIFELRERLDVPYRVVINEAVDLCKRFGATEAHKYVNAVLDRAARQLRPPEQGGPG
jgi:transcription antitermination protein NusB